MAFKTCPEPVFALLSIPNFSLITSTIPISSISPATIPK
jgi:hypothetical protein